jgi:hypothetical protein
VEYPRVGLNWGFPVGVDFLTEAAPPTPASSGENSASWRLSGARFRLRRGVPHLRSSINQTQEHVVAAVAATRFYTWVVDRHLDKESPVGTHNQWVSYYVRKTHCVCAHRCATGYKTQSNLVTFSDTHWAFIWLLPPRSCPAIRPRQGGGVKNDDG